MATHYRVSCDGCGAEKKAANHWFLLFERTDGVLITRWEPEEVDNADGHVCGEQCAHALLSNWFANGNLATKKEHA